MGILTYRHRPHNNSYIERIRPTDYHSIDIRLRCLYGYINHHYTFHILYNCYLVIHIVHILIVDMTHIMKLVDMDWCYYIFDIYLVHRLSAGGFSLVMHAFQRPVFQHGPQDQGVVSVDPVAALRGLGGKQLWMADRADPGDQGYLAVQCGQVFRRIFPALVINFFTAVAGVFPDQLKERTVRIHWNLPVGHCRHPSPGFAGIGLCF